MFHVLYNPYAGNNKGEENAKKLCSITDEELKFHDMTKVDYKAFLSEIGADEKLLIAGGDGTLNRFVNDTDEILGERDVYYFAIGSGNDFMREVGGENEIVNVSRYLKNLPSVEVNGKKYKFINGIGYGIDGYCCEVGDKMREEAVKKINYTSIAIKGLLFHYHPTNATVTVDGRKHTYKKVWLAPTMNGKYYGGGMIPTPGQNRISEDRTVSTMIYYGVGKLKALTVFPSIFKGEHVSHKDMVDVMSGHEITVEFDKPTPLQIDGETILGVTKYTVTSKVEAKQDALV